MKSKRHIVLISLLILFFSCDNSSVTDSESDSDNNGDQAFSFNHERNPGDSATDFLTDDDFDTLIIEIDYMEGYRPTDAALGSLEDFLNERLHKKTVTVLSPSEIPAEGQSSYSATEVRNLEEGYRSEYSEENRLVAYLIILDGEYDKSNVLGIAHYNTSMALFGETIQQASGVGQNSRKVVEATVMRHEFGHILGLVDNGVDMQQEHKDEQNGNHCNNENCLMYYSVRTTDFFAVLLGGNIPALDDECLADLNGAGGK